MLSTLFYTHEHCTINKTIPVAAFACPSMPSDSSLVIKYND